MTSPTLVRHVSIMLIASALLWLLPDKIHETLLNQQIHHSLKKSDQIARARIERAYGKFPMRFETNQGQAGAQVKFTARGAGYALFLTGDEAVLQLKSAGLRMKLAGSNRSSR